MILEMRKTSVPVVRINSTVEANEFLKKHFLFAVGIFYKFESPVNGVLKPKLSYETEMQKDKLQTGISRHFISESNDPLDSIVRLSSENEMNIYVKSTNSKQNPDEYQYEILYVLDAFEISAPNTDNCDTQQQVVNHPSHLKPSTIATHHNKQPDSLPVPKRKQPIASDISVDEKLSTKKPNAKGVTTAEGSGSTIIKPKLEKS